MLNVQILGLVDGLMTVSISSLDGCEIEELPLDTVSAVQIKSIMEERPFKPRGDDSYSWYVIGVQESRGNPTKEIVIEIRRHKSRVRRQAVIPKTAFLPLWNIFQYRKLLSQIGAEQRGH